MASGTILQSIDLGGKPLVMTATWLCPPLPERITFTKQSRGQNAMQKGSKPRTRLSSLQDTHRICMPEQIPVLQSPSTCHMQFLIHLDTIENNSPGEEEQGGLAKKL